MDCISQKPLVSFHFLSTFLNVSENRRWNLIYIFFVWIESFLRDISWDSYVWAWFIFCLKIWVWKFGGGLFDLERNPFFLSFKAITNRQNCRIKSKEPIGGKYFRKNGKININLIWVCYFELLFIILFEFFINKKCSNHSKKGQ